MTSYEQRQARSRELSAWLRGRIDGLAPKEADRWDSDSWELVDGASAEFVVALANWEADPSDATIQSVSVACDRVLDAYHTAAALADD